jgi:hypothetical protein
MPRPRGAFPSPRHILAAATPHNIISGEPPAQFLRKPSQLSFWLNDVDGDCVTAEEAFKCSCGGVLISDEEVLNWATSRGVLNGAFLPDVMGMMHKHGFQQGGEVYGGGKHESVDWTNEALLQNAIWEGPVKIGVAAGQLENVVPNPPANGWIATGFTEDQNEDHCVSLCGYGEIGWLANELGVGSPVPGNTPAYAMFTWSSIGIIDRASLLAICWEAWIRTPSLTVTPL